MVLSLINGFLHSQYVAVQFFSYRIVDLIFALFNVVPFQDVPLHHGSTKAYFCSPLCSIPFTLPCMWWYAVCALLLWNETRVSAVLAGAFVTLFFAWNVVQSVWRARSETKRSHTPWLSDTPNFKLINEVRTLTYKIFCIFSYGWIDCRDTFPAVLCLYWNFL